MLTILVIIPQHYLLSKKNEIDHHWSFMCETNYSQSQERGPQRIREQVRILKEVGTLKAALISVVKPGQASAAAMQCLAEFGIYHDLKMTPQKAHHVTLCPQ